MKKALRCLLMLATMAVLFVLPSAMANDSISATLNDADNLSLDRPAVVIVNFKVSDSDTRPTVTLSTDGECALFDDMDEVTIAAEKLSDGSYRVRAIATLCETSGTIDISTSDGQSTSVSFTAKEEADDGLPTLTTGNSSSDDEVVSSTKDEDESASDEDVTDDSEEYDTDRTLVIYAGTANTSIPTDKNVGFSAVLIDSLGKVVSMGGAEEWSWSVTLNGEDIDFTESTSHAINVKPEEEGELVVGCVLSLGEKQYKAEDLTLQVSVDDAVLESITIASDQSSVVADEQVTFTRTLNPEYCTDLEGADVEWKAVQNDETIALGSGTSFTFRPDKTGDVTVTLTITPDGKNAIVSNAVTVKVTEEADDATLKSVSIEADSQTDDVRVGDTLTLNAVTDPEDAEDVTYTWSVIDSDNQETILASHKATIDLDLDEAGAIDVCLSAKQNGVKVQADRLALNVTETALDDSEEEAEENAVETQDPEESVTTDDEDAAQTEDTDTADNTEDSEGTDNSESDAADPDGSDEDSDELVTGSVQDTDDDSNAGGDAVEDTRSANSGSTSVSVLATYETTTGDSDDSGTSTGSGSTTTSASSTSSTTATVDSTQPATGTEDLNATAKVMASMMILGVSCLLIYAVRRSRQHEIHYL